MASTTWQAISMNGWLRAIPRSMRRTSGFAVPKTCQPCPRPEPPLACRLTRAGRGTARRLPGQEGIDHAGEAPPRIGATQKSQSCCSAQPSAKTAVAVLRAGLRERLVTGIPAQLISATARPMAKGAKPCGARLSVDAQNDQEEKERKDRFGAEAGQERIAGRGNARRSRWRRSRRGRTRPVRWR